MTTFTQALSTDAWNRPAIGLDTDIGQIGVLKRATVHEGRLVVCACAVDAAEARGLLAMLGIGVGEPGRSGNTVRTEANRRRRVARAARAAL